MRHRMPSAAAMIKSSPSAVSLVGAHPMLGVIALVVLVQGAQAAEFRPVPPPLLPGSAAVQGRVLDAVTDAPVAGLEVRLIENDAAGAVRRGPRDLPRTATTRTDSRGVFSFTKVGAGTYGIMV